MSPDGAMSAEAWAVALGIGVILFGGLVWSIAATNRPPVPEERPDEGAAGGGPAPEAAP